MFRLRYAYSFHIYRWNQFKVIPLASTVRTRYVLPHISNTFDAGDTRQESRDTILRLKCMEQIAQQLNC